MFQSLLYANTVQIYSSEIRKKLNKWRLPKKNAISSSDPDHAVQISLFDYVKKLGVNVRERYLKKISTIGIDPVLIVGKHFEPDCLPNRLICSAILFSRLAIIRKKAFRSLEAYNQIWIITAKDGTINCAHCWDVGQASPNHVRS